MDERPPSPARSSLTPEQRSRIALQKQLALARRTLYDANKSQLLSSSPTIGVRAQLFLPNEERCPDSPAQGQPSEIDHHKAMLVRQLFSECEPDHGTGKDSTGREEVFGQGAPILEGHGAPKVLKVAMQQTSDASKCRNIVEGVSAENLKGGEFRSIDLRTSTSICRDANKKGAHASSMSVPCKGNKIMLSRQQLEVLKAVAAGKSVFITGSAGTGKSFLLGYIISILKKHLGSDVVYVTASTGLAACALGGVTLHSFAGIGMGLDDMKTMAAKVMGKKEARERWRRAMILIIDEISMIDGDLFDKLDYVARVVRNAGNRTLGIENHCFGGIQLVVTGDFFQLPPVKVTNPNKYFAFQADCWDKCFDVQIELKHAFRQSDQSFVDMLNEVRTGNPSSQTLRVLGSCCQLTAERPPEVVVTRLYAQKAHAKEENIKELQALKQKIFKFTALDSAESPMYEAMLNESRADKELELCVGAEVMLIVNYDTEIGLVNGAKGVVVGFDLLPLQEGDIKESIARGVSPTLEFPVVRFHDNRMERRISPERHSLHCGNREVAKRIQLPLILAWALTIHKCQGMTLDIIEADLSRAFDYGMVYVALSRVKKLEGLQLLGFDHAKIKVHPSVLQFYQNLSRCKLNH